MKNKSMKWIFTENKQIDFVIYCRVWAGKCNFYLKSKFKLTFFSDACSGCDMPNLFFVDPIPATIGSGIPNGPSWTVALPEFSGFTLRDGSPKLWNLTNKKR